MKPSTLATIVASLVALLTTSACEDRGRIPHNACAEMYETKDPVRKAELEKYCPRGGPPFMPSKPKEW